MDALSAADFRSCARSLYVTHETIDFFIENAKKAELEAVVKFISKEHEVREKNKRVRLLKKAKFPTIKSIEEYNFENLTFPDEYTKDDLCSLDFISRTEDFIFYGKTGRGKTHLAIALGIAAVNEGLNVRFFTAVDLVATLSRAKAEEKLDRLIDELKKVDLLILDELGYVPFDITGARLLYQVICNSYEHNSVIFTTNIEFSKWGTIFADEKMTSSLVDRIIHHGRLIEFGGESYRMDTSLMLGKSKK